MAELHEYANLQLNFLFSSFLLLSRISPLNVKCMVEKIKKKRVPIIQKDIDNKFQILLMKLQIQNSHDFMHQIDYHAFFKERANSNLIIFQRKSACSTNQKSMPCFE